MLANRAAWPGPGGCLSTAGNSVRAGRAQRSQGNHRLQILEGRGKSSRRQSIEDTAVRLMEAETQGRPDVVHASPAELSSPHMATERDGPCPDHRVARLQLCTQPYFKIFWVNTIPMLSHLPWLSTCKLHCGRTQTKNWVLGFSSGFVIWQLAFL